MYHLAVLGLTPYVFAQLLQDADSILPPASPASPLPSAAIPPVLCAVIAALFVRSLVTLGLLAHRHATSRVYPHPRSHLRVAHVLHAGTAVLCLLAAICLASLPSLSTSPSSPSDSPPTSNLYPTLLLLLWSLTGLELTGLMVHWFVYAWLHLVFVHGVLEGVAPFVPTEEGLEKWEEEERERRREAREQGKGGRRRGPTREELRAIPPCSTAWA